MGTKKSVFGDYFGGLLTVMLVIFQVSGWGQGTEKQKKAGDLMLVPYEFKTEDGKQVPAELGRLIVPEKRSNPKSNLIEIVFVRFKSTAKNPGPPIVYLSGGPGKSGIDFGRKLNNFSMIMPLREAGDVILLDQRSAGMSSPRLICRVNLDLPLDRPLDRELVLRVFREKGRIGAEHWKSQGVDLSGYTTVENADDVNALREALGARKICLLAGSYGAHLGLATIRRHEAYIHRAFLALIEGPDQTIKLPSDTQKQMEKIDSLVKLDPELSKMMPDFLGTVRAVLDRLEKEPVTVTVNDEKTKQPLKVTVGKFDLQWSTARAAGYLETFTELPARYYAMSKGDFSWLAGASLRIRQDMVGNAMAHMMDCASGASKERLARIQREAQGTLLEDLTDFPKPYYCDAWGSPDLGPEFRTNVRSDVPALFMSGTLDGRTPVSNTEEARRGFPNSEHLIVEGLAHSFGDTPEIREKISAIWLEFFLGKPLSTLKLSQPIVKFRVPTQK